MKMNNIQFQNPEFFWGLLLLPVLVVAYIFVVYRRRPKVIHSSSAFLVEKGNKRFLVHLPFVLQMLAFVGCIIAIARPQSMSEKVEYISKSGIDIVISLDVSTSMKGLDFKPNRLEASKNIAIDFVNGRINDRVGLVIYAGESFSQCPITSDYKTLKNLIKEVNFDMLQDGTAIGMGLASAVSRLKDSKADSKVVILLSDGENNSGTIAPETASDLAKEFGIRVYTIAVGKEGIVQYPGGVFGNTSIESNIDVELLKSIADNTGGKFFRADNNQKMIKIYQEIEKLEKTEISELRFSSYQEHYRIVLIVALFLLIFQRLMKLTVLKTIA